MTMQTPRKKIDVHKFLPVKKTIKYWDNLLGHFFDFSSRCYEPKSAKPKWIKNTSRKICSFEKKYGYFSSEKALVGEVTNDIDDVAICCDFLRFIHKKIKDPILLDQMTAEFLSKVLAYRNLEYGMQIPISIIEPDGTISLQNYTVDYVFDLWKEMRAFGLLHEKNNKNPLLLFRGTDFSLFSKGGRASIISDIDPKGPGRSLYKHAKKPLKKWIESACHHQLKVRFFGYSLGGTLAAHALIDNAKYVTKSPNLPSYLFQLLGVPTDIYRKWKSLPSQPYVKTFVGKGDLVSKFGKLIGNVYELSTFDNTKPITAHTMLYFMRSSASFIPIDLEKENRCKHRRQYSKFHQKMSSIFYHLGLKHLLPKK